MPELLSSGIFMHGGMDTRMKWMGEMKTDLVIELFSRLTRYNCGPAPMQSWEA